LSNGGDLFHYVLLTLLLKNRVDIPVTASYNSIKQLNGCLIV